MPYFEENKKRNQECYNLFYGIGCERRHNMSEIARKFEISRERVRQIVTREEARRKVNEKI